MNGLINSHNSWGKLEEIWLGDVYPAKWYDHLSSEVRDCFYEITEKTQQDLTAIQQKLEEFGVVVRRPVYTNIDDYILYGTEQLKKPEITPRDDYVTIGQTLYAKTQYYKSPWQSTIDLYVEQGGIVENKLESADLCALSGSNIVRIGRDLYIDLYYDNNRTQQITIDNFKNNHLSKFNDYRVHLLFNGGHIDGCFATIKPGLILASDYFSDYNRTFPNWELINVFKPEYWHHSNAPTRSGPHYNGKWWMPGWKENKAFSEHIVRHAQDWIGDYTETYFDINCLMLDEHNILMLGDNEIIFKELNRHGINVHQVPFRTRTFWDGGLHCLTVDIRRQGICEDFFPHRGDVKLVVYE